MTEQTAYPVEFEAILALAPAPLRTAFRQTAAIVEQATAIAGRLPSPDAAQRVLLSALMRAGGTEDDLRFLIVHELADETDLFYWRRNYPHASLVNRKDPHA